MIGGHLGFFPETTCNIKVIGYYCIVLDLLVLKTYIKPPKTTFYDIKKNVMVLSV